MFFRHDTVIIDCIGRKRMLIPPGQDNEPVIAGEACPSAKYKIAQSVVVRSMS